MSGLVGGVSVGDAIAFFLLSFLAGGPQGTK